jgi:hypothetical protein
MSKQELIGAYVSGRIGRRDFVRRLTALGVSATAAAAYATSLTSAAASGGRDAAGLRVRAQTDVYGLGDFGTLEQSIQTLLGMQSVLEAIVDGGFGTNLKAAPLRKQNGDELDPDDKDQIATLRTQLASHSGVLTTLLRDIGGSPAANALPKLTYDVAEDALADLESAYDLQLGVFASVIPATTNVEALATFAKVSLVQGRHGAFVNRLLDDPAFPETFQKAATPDEVDTLLAGL